MNAAFRPLALEAAGHFVRTRITAEDRAGIMVAEVAFQYLPEGHAGKYATLFAAAAELAEAAEATLLFHSGGTWDSEKRTRWLVLTGEEDATTRILCDVQRRALTRAGRTP